MYDLYISYFRPSLQSSSEFCQETILFLIIRATGTLRVSPTITRRKTWRADEKIRKSPPVFTNSRQRYRQTLGKPISVNFLQSARTCGGNYGRHGVANVSFSSSKWREVLTRLGVLFYLVWMCTFDVYSTAFAKIELNCNEMINFSFEKFLISKFFLFCCFKVF